MKLIWVWIAGALAVLVAVEWYWPAEQPEIPDFTSKSSGDGGSEEPATELGAIAGLPEAALYASVNQRPLFIEGRRPQDPDAPVEAAKPEAPPARKTPPPRLQLTGIVTIGGNTFAMVKGGKSPKKGKQATSQRLVVGGTAAEGWQVKNIFPDRVVLASGTEQHELLLREYKPVPLPKAGGAKKDPKGKSQANARASRDKAVQARKARARNNEKQKKEVNK